MNSYAHHNRGMPKWREKQRTLSVEDKIALLGKTIQESLKMERIKKSWKQSAEFSKSSSRLSL